MVGVSKSDDRQSECCSGRRLNAFADQEIALANHNTFHSNISPSYPLAHVPSCIGSRIVPDGIPTIAVPRPVTELRQATCASISITAREPSQGAQSTLCCVGFLCWDGDHCCWVDWSLDEVATWQSRSMALGYLSVP